MFSSSEVFIEVFEARGKKLIYERFSLELIYKKKFFLVWGAVKIKKIIQRKLVGLETRKSLVFQINKNCFQNFAVWFLERVSNWLVLIRENREKKCRSEKFFRESKFIQVFIQTEAYSKLSFDIASLKKELYQNVRQTRS